MTTSERQQPNEHTQVPEPQIHPAPNQFAERSVYDVSPQELSGYAHGVPDLRDNPVPQHLIPGPNVLPSYQNQPETSNASFWDRKKKIGTAVTAALAIAGVSVGAMIGLHNDNEATRLSEGSERSTSLTIDPATVDSDVFIEQLTRTQEMDYAGPKLNASIEQDTILVNQLLDESGWSDYNYFNRPVVPPSLDNTPQQIWDQITLGYAHVRNLAIEGDVEEARKLATAVAEGQEYDELVATFADGGANNLEIGVGHDDNALPVISSGSYSGVPSNGLGLIEFTKEALATTDFDQVRVVARFTKGSKEDSGRWVLVKTMPVS